MRIYRDAMHIRTAVLHIRRFRISIPSSDIYGYGRGDEVLLCLAQCLNDRVDPSRDFVGHIGGDDFLLVLGPEDWRKRLNQLLDDFHSNADAFTAANTWKPAASSPPTAKA